MTVAILGDVHGYLPSVQKAAQWAHAAGAVALIQVGDFGFFPDVFAQHSHLKFPLPVYAIDGNHEDFRVVSDFETDRVSHVFDRVYYVPRGHVMDMDGRCFAFLGGAGSIDKEYRLRQRLPWFPEEQITDADVERLLRNVDGQSVDFFITHCPPQRTITKHFEVDPFRKVRMFGVSPDWYDPSAYQVERAWHKLGYPPLYCGHMHQTVNDGDVHILNIDQLTIV